MKHVKMLGLAAVAALALAAFGASSASATELFEENTTLGVGTTIQASNEGSANLTSTGGTVLDTCTTSEVHGQVTVAAGEEVQGEVESLSFSNCTEPVTVTSLGTLTIKHIANTDNGTVYAKGFHVDVNTFTSGTQCAYTAGEKTHLGTLTGVTKKTEHATLHIDAVVTKATGGILCPASAKWVATYKVTSPTGLNVRA